MFLMSIYNFEVCDLYDKKDIDVQKIKVKQFIF